MFTQCPNCDAIFQVSASQLKAANGDVRCGQCLSVFNALDHLSEDIPQNPEADTTANEYDFDPFQSEPGSTAENTTASIEASPASSEASEAKTGAGDVFSEVIAKASTHEVPKEEIDRFEEFLEADTLAEDEGLASESAFPGGEGLSADESLQAEGSLPAEDDSPDEESQAAMRAALANNPFLNKTALVAETTRATDDAQPAEDKFSIETTPAGEDTATESVSFDAEATEETTLADTDTELGDIDDATADLTATVDTNDDEFAELDAYLHDKAMPAAMAPSEQTGTDGEQIIINDSDLEPVASTDYADTPQAAAKTAAESASEAETAEGETQVVNIPTLILDDLHAARAEQMRPSNTPWIVGSLVLMLTLVLQVVYHSRDELARDASLRPWLIQMCDVVGCTLTQPYDIKQIEIIGRDVRSHPTARKALIVSTSLINNADFVQPFPLLTMSFSDINGTLVAKRRFTPREYLSNDTDREAGMIPDMPVRIELELVDPGKNAVNYEFNAEVDPRQTRPLS